MRNAQYLQVFVGYYIPKLNVNKRVSAISAPAKGDDRALTVFKEDREEKREERCFCLLTSSLKRTRA